jgi:hypothetical protein
MHAAMICFAFFAIRAAAINPPDHEQMIPFSIEQMTTASDLVVLATVEELTVRRDLSGQIFTEIAVAPAEYWKGAGPKKRLLIIQGGGTLGLERVTVSGQNRFEPGEEVALYVVFNTRKEAIVYAMTQGKFSVTLDQETGIKTARNPFHGSAPGTNSKQAKTLEPVSRGALLSLESLKNQTLAAQKKASR